MDKRLISRFAHKVILQKDTPSLILELAGNVRYLMLCREIVNCYKINNHKLFDLLSKVCFEHGIDLEWLKDRLTPAAKALGLHLERVAQLDYYAILGIKEDADLPKIKKAYRKKAHLTHPDTKGTCSDDNKAFIEINHAYQTLSDSVLRHHYDLSRKNFSRWSEEPAQGLKVKDSRIIFALQLISLLLILLLMVFLFDFIFHESSTL
jgi:DnaJ-domain-containing protein 1